MEKRRIFSGKIFSSQIFTKSSSALKICASDKPSNLMPFSTPKSRITEQIIGNQGPSQIDFENDANKKKIP